MIIKYKFTIEEIRALYRLVEHEWVNRDDEEQIQVVKRIADIVKQDELATGISKSA